jgi:cytoskeletal protein CcmA (bactofilin family)
VIFGSISTAIHFQPSNRRNLMKFRKFTLIVCLTWGLGLNGGPPPNDIIIEAGSTYNNDITTTTSDIIVLNGAEVKGDLETTYGDVYLEESARADKITTINGNVYLDKNSQVDKTINTQNGTIRVRESATVKGNITTEWGDIRGDGAIFNKNISTRHGHISLKAGSYVKGNVSILNRGHGNDLPVVEIYLGEDVYVKGKVTASHVGDNVDLYMWNAEVDGQINKVNVVDGEDEEEEDEEDDEGEDNECGGRPEWSKDVQYQTNDEVHKDGTAYRAKKNSKKKDPTNSKNNKYWIDLGDC